MFEAGSLYEVELMEQDGSRSFIRGEAIAFEGTLLKLLVDKRQRVINTAASAFVGAVEYRLPTNPLYQSGKPPVIHD